MKRDTRSYFEVLLCAAFESSTLRVVEAIPMVTPQMHAYAYDAARTATRKLAYWCKRGGRDARDSPLYEGLEFKDDYVACYEAFRRVRPDVLTPKVIFDHTSLGNVVVWEGWQAMLWGHSDASDPWGRRAKVFTMIVRHEDGREFRLDQQDSPHERARQVYRLMTGESYRWDDHELTDDSGFSPEYLAQT